MVYVILLVVGILVIKIVGSNKATVVGSNKQVTFELRRRGEHEEVIKRLSSDPDELQAIADSYFNLEQHEECFAVYRKALAMCSNEYVKDKIRMNIAKSYYKIEAYEEALDFIQEITDEQISYLRKEKDYSYALIAGSCWYHMGEYEHAIEAYKQAPLTAKILNQSLKDILFQSSFAYEKAGYIEKALKNLNRLKTTDRKYPGLSERIEELKKI